ncbi:hypothetical protein TNCV_1520111 [Trichonephila clavipes]|nr:hypothetical protein TNCV_1520111 [Trichonephila clavipes]
MTPDLALRLKTTTPRKDFEFDRFNIHQPLLHGGPFSGDQSNSLSSPLSNQSESCHSALAQAQMSGRTKYSETHRNDQAQVTSSDSRLNKAFKLCNFISKIMVDFHKRILFGDEAPFWLNGYVNKQNCRIWSEANPQVYVETPLHPEKLTVWCALWAGGILLQKR